METNDLEFSITQYLDGNLPPGERASLEARIQEDPQAQAMLAAHRRLTAALKGMPLPAVRWDAFARSISQAVDTHEEQSARSYRMPTWVRLAIPLALAASVLIVASVAVHYLSRPTNVARMETTHVPAVPESGPSSIIVIGPAVEKTTGPVVVQVSIGPSAAAKDEPTVVQYSDDVVSRPSSVTIASGVVPAHDDTDALLGDMQ